MEDAIYHHLNVVQSARLYDPVVAGVATDLSRRMGPISPLLNNLDPLEAEPIRLSYGELDDLAAFVREGLLDPRARPENLCRVIPKVLPSGMPLQIFEGCL